ncbi:MAG: hypothetical protein D6731_24480 [Planctomycetota bacterium]|nr:MAG: hypothetical protein D6731_24480 [Planctomycetota bacterium]
MSAWANLLVHVALLVAGFKLWRWARRAERAQRTRWRRRFAALFFVSPMLFGLLAFLLPANPLLDGLLATSRWLDGLVERLVGTAQEAARENAPGALGVLAVKPAVRSVVYALLGAAVGWPLDRRARRAAAEGDGAESEKALQ